jgi:hypothetical protein
LSEVKIGVSAGVQGVDAAIQKITNSFNKLGAEVAKVSGIKFEPTDAKLMARDLALINKQAKELLALSPQIRNALKATGQEGAHVSQWDFSKLSTDPRAAQRMRDRAFRHVTRGTALDPTAYNETDSNGNIIPPGAGGGGGGGGGGSGGSGGGGGGGGRRPGRGGSGGSGGSGDDGTGSETSWWKRRPAGGFGQASATAIGDGVGGAAGGILTAGIAGGPAGALLATITSGIGALKQMTSEGMDMVEARNNSLDLLKRQMGDVGISFSGLIGSTKNGSLGLGLTNPEFAGLMQSSYSASGGMDGTGDSLASRTRQGVQFARAYGMDPAAGVSFMSGMARLDKKRDNADLAKAIAEAIDNSRGNATGQEVAQAMQVFASTQNRYNGSNVDLNRFGNAFASLVGTGMTADHASGIMGAANAGLQNMGNNEVSLNYLMRATHLNPIEAQMRAQEGVLATGINNQYISSYMRTHGDANWDNEQHGPNAPTSDLILKQMDSDYSRFGKTGGELELMAIQKQFGMKSLGDAAAFYGMSTSDHNSISTLLKNAGITDFGHVNVEGMQAIAGLGRQADMPSLQKYIDSNIMNRPDLSQDERDRLRSAEQGGDYQKLMNAAVQIMAPKGQEGDVATDTRDIKANIARIKELMGDAIVPLLNDIQKATLHAAGMDGAIGMNSGGGAPYGYGSSPPPVGAGRGISVSPGGISAAPGGSTVGGAGNARMPRGQVPGQSQYYESGQDTVAGWANNLGGAFMGGWYSSNVGVADGMKQLMGMGVDKDHAAAIMASAIRESSMDPSKVGDHGQAYGLFQLHPDRQKDFARVMGRDVHGSSAQEQIDYMYRSLQKGGEEAGPGSLFWKSSGKDAARVFSNKVERPDHPGREADLRSSIAQTLGETNFNLTLVQNDANGKSKTSKIRTKIPAPTSAGLTIGPIIEIPGK